MTFLAPHFFYLGLGVAASVVALHFIVTRQPVSSPLPTARFVPKSSVRVTTIAPPQHWWLMALRALAGLLIGAAFARPVLTPERRPVARIVLADVSRTVGSIDAVRDSVRALLVDGDALIVFDTGARVIRVGAADSAALLERSDLPGRLSPALIRALRVASTMRDAADSIELSIVSSLRASEADAATAPIRALWPGRIRLVQVRPSDTSEAVPMVTVRASESGDGVALAAQLAGLGGGESTVADVRVVRGPVLPSDTAWLTAPGRRRTLVRWPAAGAPAGWRMRERADTVGAVVIGEIALVHPLQRRWRPDTALAVATVVARWVDGETAALEQRIGGGCIRDVAIPVPVEGDVVLRPTFARFVRELTKPCAALAAVGPALGPEALAMLAGRGPLAAREAIGAPEWQATPLVPWLITAALLLLLLELWVRRGGQPLWTDVGAQPEPMPEQSAA